MPYFPDGLGTYTVSSNSYLTFEKGPSQTIQLQWGTYYDAADQAGLSRLWGGIHVSVDDLTGRRIGSQSGQEVWALVQKYFDGSIASAPTVLAMRSLNPTQCELRYSTYRGLYYKLQSTPDLTQPFADEPGGLSQAQQSSSFRIDNVASGKRFYRVVSALTP